MSHENDKACTNCGNWVDEDADECHVCNHNLTTIRMAATAISETYYREPWFVSCGITGETEADEIHFMVTRQAPKDIKHIVKWSGFIVKIIISGKAKAASR